MRALRISRTSWQAAGALIATHLLVWAWISWRGITYLIATHLLVWAWISWRGITYDWGGFEGLLWWLVAFLVLPVMAAVVLIASSIKGQHAPRDEIGD